MKKIIINIDSEIPLTSVSAVGLAVRFYITS